MSVYAPLYREVLSREELPDEFFGLFLDPTRTYSCALWTHPDDTLEKAQTAKIDLALAKCDLQPGMTLLDVGCGWGSTMLRAMDTYGVNTIGLTRSRNQYRYVRDMLVDRLIRGRPYGGVRVQGWEDFDRRADRIVCVGAMEHLPVDRYGEFFEFAYRIMPSDGVLLLQTVVSHSRDHLRAHGTRITGDDFAFLRFLRETIFPGGQLPLSFGHYPKGITEYAQEAGFTVADIQSLGPHYTTTLDCWADALHEHRDRAIELAGRDTYNAYIRYLTGSAEYFRRGHIDVMQFTCLKPDARYRSPLLR
ncbi:class I SAM-dependent methyltransferase [Nocardia gamkensis]|uniref:Methyltransferase domain-containing protein n=1 Tax=Nocardia gamkensis TaxID=352869 RepID=A0A7X6R4N4_9NOCA|nr:class I SAM-dependent methyltransferase [Nocardia gamkensis]NKY28522.1 methyltransferase domain-containing protein [Nocardia gamkensis]NQE69094.1 Cyclopropane mycolic acid synthase 1 [Nocardia gamkensis]